MHTNLLTHEVLNILENLALPEYRGDGGRERLVDLLETNLQVLGASVATARLSDFRKLWHDGWSQILDRAVGDDCRTLVSDRFKSLIF